jgi:hypothetical protein
MNNRRVPVRPPVRKKDKTPVTMNPVKSTFIEAIGHDPDTSELHVQMRGGDTYVFSGKTAADHAAMLQAESVGKHFHANVRGGEFRRQKRAA